MKQFFSKGKFYKIPLILLLVLFIVFTLWAYLPHRTMDVAKEALRSDSVVEVKDEGHWIRVSSKDTDANTGIILYPGARVDPEAYGIFARDMAKEGVSVYLVKMPYRIAFFASNRADEIIEKEPSKRWYLMGHSLGGAVASKYAADHEDEVEGLIFIGSYPLEGPDYKSLNLSYVSIYGSEDGLVTESDRQKAREQLPDDAKEVIIKGGNHAGFGYYGPQGNDGEAMISRDEQTSQVIDAVLEFIKK